MSFVMTIFTSWMLGLHTDSVSIYHSVYTTFTFAAICFISLMGVTENPSKTNAYKIGCIYLFSPMLGWFLISLIKFSLRTTPEWDINDSDFLDLLCYTVCIVWEVYLIAKGMPTYYELFFFGVYERENKATDQHIMTHRVIGGVCSILYTSVIVIASVFQPTYENSLHLIFNFLPFICLSVATVFYTTKAKQRSDAKVFTASNYSLTWFIVFTQVSLIVQSLAYLLKYTTYNTCSDCYLGIIYSMSTLPMLYYVFYGFQRFTIDIKWFPKYLKEDQVLFFTTTATAPIVEPVIEPVVATTQTENQLDATSTARLTE